MPTLRQSLKDRRFSLKVVVALVLAAALIADWSRPPQKQVSVFLYNKVVAGPYRWLIRPMSTCLVRCRYVPTCSAYSVEAVSTHGMPKGAWLTLRRLLRCMPWVPMHTHDPVPPPQTVHS